MIRKVKAVILSNESPDDHLLWVHVCRNHKENVDYRIVNLTQDDWFEHITSESFDVLLSRPGGLTSSFKQLYDERIYILGKVCNYKIFPSVDEILIYENKRYLSSWLKATGLPHPETHVFYNPGEAQRYIKTASFPLVAKINIGASGSGVKILASETEAHNYINDTFQGRGASRRWGPKLSVKKLPGQFLRILKNPSWFNRKLNKYKAIRGDIQKDFVLFQKYVPHTFEWRAVRIGDSFFAHKKLMAGEKASGSLLKDYSNPPLSLFDFIREITDNYHFRSMALDIFEPVPGEYLINELQCLFGQSDPYQMEVDGKPGRYKFENDNWVFEEGDFAKDQCYDLRIKYVIEQFND
jgi:hypothetical protein